MIHPGPYHRRPRSGRRARRGLSALTAVLLLAGLLATVAMNWQIVVARERLRGQARHLAGVVAAEGYGLHHWLHEERVAGTAPDPGEDTAGELSGDERTRLASHPAIATWRRSSIDRTRILLPRGWEIVHLVGRTTGEDLPDGILVLRPSDDIVNRPTWDALARALDVVLGSGTGAAAVDLASAALADYDAIRDRAYFTSRFARLDTNAVLRQRHAGHPTLPMETDIDLGGNDLSNVKTLRARTGAFPSLTGACPDPAGALCATDLTARGGVTVTGGARLGTVEATDATVTGDVTGIDWIRTGDVTVSGTVTTPVLTACTDTTADLCGGGDLDLGNAAGTPDWSRATIFGNLKGREITGVTTITAKTGIFDRITGAPVLTVNDCFRSVTPFVHGAGC